MSPRRDPNLFGLFVEDRRGGAVRALPLPSASHRRMSGSARAPERGLLARGAILDKYRIEALVGTGGFAAVYRATHLLLRIPVAIKLLRPRVLSRDPGIGRQLLEEARYAARIDHPNVVRIQDVTHTDEITYIVMEFIDGVSLAKAIEASGRLPAKEVAGIAIDVAEGLRAGLEEGLIHRDIKPANILLARSGRARIVDFGLAYAASLPSSSSSSSPCDAGSQDEPAFAGQIVGTRGYMAPEQARHPQRVDFRADVYALGATMCQALTGVAPYMHRGDADRVRNVPAALSALLRRMTAPSPSDRPSSYEALLAALRHAAHAL